MRKSKNKLKSFILICFLSLFPSLLFNGCPHQMVKQLDETFPDSLFQQGKYKPNYKTTFGNYIDYNKFKIKSNNIEQKKLDSSSYEFAIQSEIIAIKSANYPNEIVLNVQVFDNQGNYIIGLAPPYYKGTEHYKTIWSLLTDSCNQEKSIIEDFTVTEIRQATAEKHSIVFLLDHSPSMGHEKAKLLQQVVKKVSEVLDSNNYISVIKFSRVIRHEVPLSPNTDSTRAKIVIDGLAGRYGSGTSIYDALHSSVKEFENNPIGYQKIIILFTDGMDNTSKLNIDSVLKVLKSKNITVYTIAFGMAETAVMKKIANYTEGRFYQIFSTKEFIYVFADIFFKLKNYYKIKYKPPVCPSLHTVGLNIKISNSESYCEGTYDKSVFTEFDPIGTIAFLNIEFEYDKADILPQSIPLLNQVIDALNRNPKMKILICGHTDDIGSDEYNLKLSKQRAKAVYDYLVKNGIKPERLKTEGYGKTKPLVPNDSDENRRINRRTEFIIIEN